MYGFFIKKVKYHEDIQTNRIGDIDHTHTQQSNNKL